jgi:GNAT superfamily N-acetyltransferase
MDGLTIRGPKPGEAQALTDLALRAKASWGYDAAFMAACRDELTVTAQRLIDWTFWVAEQGGAPVGIIALSHEGDVAELEDFFVDPAAHGHGVGTALMVALLAACRAKALTKVMVAADPNAEAIYQRLGYRTVGQIPSGSIPGRMLPRMELSLTSPS